MVFSAELRMFRVDGPLQSLTRARCGSFESDMLVQNNLEQGDRLPFLENHVVPARA